MRVWEYINLVGEYRNESICLLPTTGWCFSFSDRKKKQKKNPKYKREHFTLTEPNKQEQVLARATSPPGLQMKNPTSTQSIIYLNYTRYLYHCVNMTVATRKAETKSKKFYFCQKNCTFPLPFHWHLGSLDMSSVTSWHSLQYEHATAGAWATAGNTTSQRWMKKKRREKERQRTPEHRLRAFVFHRPVDESWVNLSEGGNLHKQYGKQKCYFNILKTEGMW